MSLVTDDYVRVYKRHAVMRTAAAGCHHCPLLWTLITRRRRPERRGGGGGGGGRHLHSDWLAGWVVGMGRSWGRDVAAVVAALRPQQPALGGVQLGEAVHDGVGHTQAVVDELARLSVVPAMAQQVGRGLLGRGDGCGTGRGDVSACDVRHQ